VAQGGHITSNQPVILNSIHNDGAALDLKIRDMVRLKFDESEKKGRLKEERLLQLELNAGKSEEILASTVNTLNSGIEAELNKANQQIASLTIRMN
jgi:hypothetical protein